MNNSKDRSEPKLDRPGAGLPFLELVLTKYFLFPMLSRKTTNEKAIELFSRQSQKILSLARPLSSTALIERRLVPKQQGLEDSSRYWSVAMAVEHLVVVNTQIQQVITDLSNAGKTSLKPVSTADVKPSVNVDAALILKTFEETSDQFIHKANNLNIDAFPNATFKHPWFGPLNAHQWLTLSGLHQRVHRKQIEMIISLL